jgi:hypothetical protein
VCLSTVYIAKSGLNVKDKTSTNVSDRIAEIDTLPVDFQESNTIAVVCPSIAKNNPNYPDPTCKNTDYYGVKGLNDAIYSGSRDHTVHVKNGTYNLMYGLHIFDQKRHLRIVGESRDGVIFHSSFAVDDGRLNPVVQISGDGGVTIENITVTAPEDLLNYEKYKIAGILVGSNAAVTIKNTAIYKTYAGIFLKPYTQDVKLYQNVLVNNRVGVFSKTNHNVYLENNILAFNLDYGAIFSEGSGDDFNFDLTPGEWKRGQYQFKSIYQNVFYGNRNGIFMSIPSEVVLVNNIFSQIKENAIIIPENSTYLFNSFSPDHLGHSAPIVFNYSDGGSSRFCVYPSDGIFRNFTTCPNFERGPNIANFSKEMFMKIDEQDGEFDFRASENIADLGAPYISDRDGSRSDPGAYGGSCWYDYDGCEGLEFPVLSSIPVIESGGSGVVDPTLLDLNRDGSIDLQDVIGLVKYIFAQ